MKLDQNFDLQDDPAFDDPIDYLIVTYESLEDCFKPLIDWKTQKGLRCKVKTLEEIEVEYENVGKLAALGKRLLSKKARNNALMRWLQFSINPIGDPEMPVYTEAGKTFSQAQTNIKNGELVVDTGVEDCVVCLTGELNGKPYQKVFRNIRNAVFTEIPENGVVCFTKQNYKPYIKELNEILTQSLGDESSGRIVALRGTPAVIEAELEIPELSSEVDLTLTDIMSNSTVHINSCPEEKIVEIDTRRLVGGLYILTLYVDGHVSDTKRLVIE